jgi:hypothetical protein
MAGLQSDSLRRSVSALIAFALVTITAPLSAQDDSDLLPIQPTNLFGTFALSGSSIRVSGFDRAAERGAGFSVNVGYGFTPNFAVLVGGSAARHRPSGAYLFTVSQIDIGGRVHFPVSSWVVVPCVDAALTLRQAVREEVVVTDSQGFERAGDLTMSGTGFTVGAGALYFFGRNWAWQAGLQRTSGHFSRVQIARQNLGGRAFDAGNTRLNIGIAWFPRVE